MNRAIGRTVALFLIIDHKGAKMTLQILKETYAVCRLDDVAELPKGAEFLSLTVSSDEISLVCSKRHVPPCAIAQTGFAAMRIKGVLDFSMTGVLARISGILAKEEISIFAISTYDTDYIFVRQDDLEKSIKALEANGYDFETSI